MLGTPALAAVLGAGVDNRDHDAVRAYIRELCKLGMAVMLCLPGTKQPADMRTVRTRNAADKAAQEQAKADGRADWAKVKSASGLDLATTDHGPLLKKNGYLDEYIRLYSTWVKVKPADEGSLGRAESAETVHAPTAKQIADGEVVMQTPVAVNLAVEVGASRLVVVDCDTAEQKQRFLDWLAGGQPIPPTVTSPGQVNADGDWLHSNGGHYYFTLPEGVELPTNLGAVTLSGDDGYAILWNRRYVLIPPSTRPEGAYRVTGIDYELPQPIFDEIVKLGQARELRAQQYARRGTGGDQIAVPGDDFGDAIDAWAEQTSWADILTPLGWWPAARADNCGCEVWTAGPGHASPKSATAHDPGCTLGRYTEVNTPLHIWTFDPGEPFLSWIKEHGTGTMSKLQVVALTQYSDDMGKAMDALDLIPKADDDVTTAAGIGLNNIAEAAGISSNGLDTPLWGTGPSPIPATTPPLPQSPFAVDGPATVTPISPTGIPTPEPTPLPASPFADLAAQDGPAPTVLDRMTPEQQSAAGVPPGWQPGAPLADGTPTVESPFIQPTGPEPIETPADVSHVDDETQEYIAGVSGPALPTVDSDAPFAAPGDSPQPVPAAPEESPFTDDAGDPDPDMLNTGIFGVPILAPFAHWRDMPPPEYIIDGLLEHGGLSSIIGPPGMGKSSVALDMACHIATGKRWQGRRTLKTKVLYMPGEGLSGAVQRIAAWEEAHGVEVGNNLILADSILKLQASNEAWQLVGEYVMRQNIGFIIFDTFARMALAVEENSATEVGKAVERFDQVRRYTHAGVLVVHHTGKHSETGRGSSALNGALDSELLIRKGNWDTSAAVDGNGVLPGKPIELDTTKQKNSEQLEHPIPLMMCNWEPRHAPIITGPGGSVDPMQAEIVLARPVPESVIETAVRAHHLITDSFREQGLTRTDLANYLPMDAHTAQRGDAAKAWRRKIAEAVDCGLRHELLETLSGTASGSRYIPGPATIEGARTTYAASIITAPAD